MQLVTETELVQRVADGHSSALKELQERYSAALLAEACRLLGDVFDAEEVVQDAFWKVWQHAGEYDPRQAKVSTWLKVINRRCAIDRLRYRAKRLPLLSQLSQLSELSNIDTGPILIHPDLVEKVMAANHLAVAREAMRELPREQRQVLEMAYFRDMSQTEIANALGLPLGTVKSRTTLAFKKLRQLLRRALGRSPYAPRALARIPARA
jgi:RNA polymerase sigma-70 factor, ECF subfamily